MKNIKFVTIIILLLINLVNISAQKLTAEDHYKYWYYRYRLVNEFLIPGLATQNCVASGLSIPAGAALHYKETDTHLKLRWTDNPASGLGYYIGILATELKLLYLYNQPYTNTQQELYYAMKAYERIDINCECLFDYPDNTAGGLNGLFARDDVPVNFMKDNGGHTNFRDINCYSDEVESIYKKYNEHVILDQENQVLETYYPSGEELQGLFTGFGLLVTALLDCPAEVVIYNNYRFIEEAIKHTQRFMDRMQNNDWIGYLHPEDNEIYAYGDQLLKEMIAYGWASAADFICSVKPYYVPLNINPYRHYCSDFPYITPLEDIFLAYLNGPFTAIEVIAKLYDGTLFHDNLMDYQAFAWMLRGNPESHFVGWESIGETLNDFCLWGIDIPYLNLDDPQKPIIIPYNLKGNTHFVTSQYAFAAIGNSWVDVYNNDEDITYESLINYTDEANMDIYPLLNLYLHNKNKNANVLRTKIINE